MSSSLLKKPIVTIVFDDGHSTNITAGYPILSGFNIPATVAINSSRVGVGEYMSLENLTILKNAGWGIVNHSANHVLLSGEVDAVAISEYVDCRDFLISNGFSDGAEHFIFAGNDYTENTLSVLLNEGAKTLSGAGNAALLSLPSNNRIAYPRASTNGKTKEQVVEYIDSIIANGRWMQIYFHEIRDPAEYGVYSFAEDDFAFVIEYLAGKRDSGLLEVMNFIDYANEYLLKSRLAIKTS